FATMPGDGPITSPYRSPRRPDHSGVDIATFGPVWAFEGGRIIAVGTTTNGTNYVQIQTSRGRIDGYYHLGTYLRVGDQVPEGRCVGYYDGSGRSTGPHSHFTMQGNRN